MNSQSAPGILSALTRITETVLFSPLCREPYRKLCRTVRSAFFDKVGRQSATKVPHAFRGTSSNCRSPRRGLLARRRVRVESRPRQHQDHPESRADVRLRLPTKPLNESNRTSTRKPLRWKIGTNRSVLVTTDLIGISARWPNRFASASGQNKTGPQSDSVSSSHTHSAPILNLEERTSQVWRRRTPGTSLPTPAVCRTK
jgi:hypothetical protein